jgi:hypothetical protein
MLSAPVMPNASNREISKLLVGIFEGCPMLIVCIALRTTALSVVKSTRGPGSGKPMNAA